MARIAYVALDRAYLAAIWLETLFYGVNTILFFWCLTILTIRCHTVKINKILVTVALLMVVLSTSHVSLGFYRLLKGFILLRDQPGGPAAYFSDISRPENVAKITIQGLGAVVGDSVVVWRCWLVWNRSWKICFVPIILVIGTAVCGLGQAVAFAHAQRYHDVFVLPIQIWSGALFAFSISSNVLVTGLIALRAWHLLQLSQGLTTFRTWKILLIIVESGMIYSISVTLMLSLYYLGSNSFYIIYDPIDQLGTMIPMAIIILAALGFTTNNIESRMTHTDSTSAAIRVLHTRPSHSDSEDTDRIPLHSIPSAKQNMLSVLNVDHRKDEDDGMPR